MRTIYKYPLVVTESQTISMPKGSRILSIQFQRDVLCLWAELPVEFDGYESRDFLIVGTGHSFSPKGEYLATVQSPDEYFVWHIYEITD